MNRIYAIVISFNPNIELLSREYTSVSSQVERIIYIDNLSNNRIDVVQWMEDKTQKAELILMPTNEGIGAAQNAGIKRALSKGASHIIIFDQDSVVEDGFVEALLKAEKEAISNGVKVGLTGPIYKSFDDNYLYPIITLSGNCLKKIPHDSFKTYVNVSHIIASGSLIRCEVFTHVGLLIENLFIDFIDFEYCFRARKYGYESIVTRNACMHHLMGDRQIKIMGRKIGIYSPFRRYFDSRNVILIRKKNLLPKTLCNYYLKLLFGKVVISIIFGPKRLKQLKYISIGIWDGIRGIDGICTIK